MKLMLKVVNNVGIFGIFFKQDILCMYYNSKKNPYNLNG